MYKDIPPYIHIVHNMQLEDFVYLSLILKTTIKICKQSYSILTIINGVFCMKVIIILLVVLATIISAKEIKNIEVLDGDTIAYYENDKRVRVRLYGIDAPELSQKYGEESKSKLKKLIRRKMELIVLSTDKYQREIGLLYVNKTCINSSMLLEGYAWYYVDSRPVCNLYKHHEEYARNKKLGIWKDTDNIEPWIYRKQQE